MDAPGRGSPSAALGGSPILSPGGEARPSSGARARHIPSWVAEVRFLTRGRARSWLFALLATALVHGIMYTLVVPPWQHPDEPSHFEHVRYIAEMGRLPAPDAVDLPLRREIATSMRRYDYWPHGPPSLDDASLATPYVSAIGLSTFVQPRLYYIAAGIWLKPWLGASIEAQVTIVRLMSVLLNLMLITSGFLTVRTLLPENLNLAAAAGAFLVFLPGLCDIMAAVNNDVLINALAAVLFLVLAQLFRRGPTFASVSLAGGLVVSAILTKSTGAILIGLLPLVILAHNPRSQRRWVKPAVLVLLLLAGIAAVGAWALRSHPSLQVELEASINRYFRADLWLTLQNATDPDRVKIYWTTTKVVFRSFWAAFGWRDVMLASRVYLVPLAVSGLGMLGLLIASFRIGRRPRTKTRWWRPSYLVFSGAAVSLAWLVAVIRSQAYQGMPLYLSHGRYAYIAVVPFALLLVLGLEAWVPARWRPRAVWVFLAMMVAFDAVAFWGYLVPFYHSL